MAGLATSLSLSAPSIVSTMAMESPQIMYSVIDQTRGAATAGVVIVVTEGGRHPHLQFKVQCTSPARELATLQNNTGNNTLMLPGCDA